MAGKRHHTNAPWPFSALLGGMMASVIALLVFGVLLEGSCESDAFPPLTAALVGVTTTTGLAVSSLLLIQPVPWLANALLFAGGFTLAWSAPLSLAAEPRWPMLLAMGAAVALVTAFGWRCFSRTPEPAVVPADEPES